MNQLQQAWAAGLFEGEGSIVRRQTNGWTVVISMTDLDVIERFQEAVGMGKIYGPYFNAKKKNGDACKAVYKWMLSDKPGIEQFGRIMIPYLGERRRARLNEALAEIQRLGYTRAIHKRKNSNAYRDDPRAN